MSRVLVPAGIPKGKAVKHERVRTGEGRTFQLHPREPVQEHSARTNQRLRRM